MAKIGIIILQSEVMDLRSGLDSPASIHDGDAGVDLDVLIAQFGLDKPDAAVAEPAPDVGSIPVPVPDLPYPVPAAAGDALLSLGYQLIDGTAGPDDIAAQTMKRNIRLVANMDRYGTILKLIESVGTAKTIQIVTAAREGQNLLMDAIDKLANYSGSLLSCTRTRQAYMQSNCMREADQSRDAFMQAKLRYRQVVLKGPEEDQDKDKFQRCVTAWQRGLTQVLTGVDLPTEPSSAPRLAALLGSVRTSISLQLEWKPDMALELDELIASFSACVAELSEKLGLVLEILNKEGRVSGTTLPRPVSAPGTSPLEHSISELHKAQTEYNQFIQESTRDTKLMDVDKLRELTDRVKRLQEQYETQLALQSRDLMTQQSDLGRGYLHQHPRLGQLLMRLSKSSETMTQTMNTLRQQLVARRERYEEAVRLAGEHLADRCREADSRCAQVTGAERAKARENLNVVYTRWKELLEFTCTKLDGLVQIERKTTATVWHDMSKDLAETMKAVFEDTARKSCYEAWQRDVKS